MHVHLHLWMPVVLSHATLAKDTTIGLSAKAVIQYENTGVVSDVLLEGAGGML